MRKTMEVMGLVLMGLLYWITYAALNGAERLPVRVPTHFDISGRPNAWGSPQMLWLLPLIGTGLYLLMTVLVSIRFRRYNLPVRGTEATLPLVYAKTGELVAWIKFEVVGLLTYIQWSIIQGARVGEFHLSAAVIPLFLVAVFATVGLYMKAIGRGVRTHTESSIP